LEGFEASSIEALARQYDLIVLDHPHIGDALRTNCLVPMNELFDTPALCAWRNASVGQSSDSYLMNGAQWALPLDAATQVAAIQAHRIEGSIPDTWDDVLQLARRQHVGLSLAGPHAILSYFSLAGAFGSKPAHADVDTLFATSGASDAWDVLSELHAHADLRHSALNPIGLLEAMKGGSAVVYCPLVYGYVNYAYPSLGACALLFANAPRGSTGRGSTLGGTGIAVSRSAKLTPELLDHLSWLMDAQVQTSLIPQHSGQPSAKCAWDDNAVNAASNSFYRSTRQTTESALIRPRYAHYIAFQTEASAYVRDALVKRVTSVQAIRELQALHTRHHKRGATT
jgi:multiple sugar transport system substrate-binding protein